MITNQHKIRSKIARNLVIWLISQDNIVQYKESAVFVKKAQQCLCCFTDHSRCYYIDTSAPQVCSFMPKTSIVVINNRWSKSLIYSVFLVPIRRARIAAWYHSLVLRMMLATSHCALEHSRSVSYVRKWEEQHAAALSTVTGNQCSCCGWLCKRQQAVKSRET